MICRPAHLLALLALLALATVLPAGASAQGTAATTLTPAQEAREALKNQADQAYRSGNYVESERLLNQVLAQDAKDHVAYYLRASTRVEQGGATQDPALVRSGVTDARKALGIEFNVDYYLPYLYGMSRLAEVENRPEHASAGRAVADKVLGMGKGTADQKANIYFQRSLLNLALGDKEAAKQDLRNAIKSSPKHLAAHTSLCNILLQEGNPQSAEAQFDATIAAIPDQALVYNNRGTFLQGQGRSDEAIRDFQKSVELDPKYIPALTNLGYVQVMQQKYSEAEGNLSRSLELDPKQAVAFNLRAAARLYLGQIEGAIQDYQTVVQLTPDAASAFYELGFAQFFNRDYPAARESLDQARRMDSSITFLPPWRYTAMVFSNQRDQALSEFSAVERKPEDQRTWFDVLTLFLMGKINEDRVFAAIDDSTPETKAMQECEANYFVGLRHASRNQPDQARQYFQKSLATGQRHLAAYRGAMYAVGQFDQ
ncbi:MAG: tetratricopeptide repeat protein [Planctomycetaceae bacterium]|nr:tetratricopeptide repeat protein [Planctomycetaceae bacterium]